MGFLRGRGFLRAMQDSVIQFAEVWGSMLEALRQPDVDSVLRGRIRVLAFGKASVEMTAALTRHASSSVMRSKMQLTESLVIGVPERIALAQMPGGRMPEGWKPFPADHPLPTERNITAAKAALAFAEANSDADTLLVLISGGGSAHLCWPDGDLSLEDLRQITRKLQLAGADITELNTVRKHCERLKGGRLGAAISRGRAVALVVSDVVGDRTDIISSGPLVADPTTFRDALDVIGRRQVVVAGVQRHLERGAKGLIPETPKHLRRIEHRIVSSNRLVAQMVADALGASGARVTLETAVTGDAAEIGRDLGRWLRRPTWGRSRVRVVGGEWTVQVGDGMGVGGPSMELALAAAIQMQGRRRVQLLALSTDGIDGPTDAAGALVDGATVARARAAGVDALLGLERHDSLRVLDATRDVIRIGPTGTNVNHIVIASAGSRFAMLRTAFAIRGD